MQFFYQLFCGSGLKFKCLNWKSVIDAEISDHNPVLYARNGKTFCSFNILTQCKYVTGKDADSSYFNNGFKHTESDKEYNARLINTIIPILKELFTIHKVDYFLLQEAPSNAIDAGKNFYAALQDFGVHYNDTNGVLPFGGEILLYPKATKIENVTSKLSNEISKANQQRFQAMHLTLPDNTIIKIANFHADYKNQDGTKEDIVMLVEHGYLVGGDFNLLTSPDVRVPKKEALTSRKFQSSRTYDAIYDGRGERLVHKFSCYRLCC